MTRVKARSITNAQKRVPSNPPFSNKNKKELLANEQPEAEAAAAAPTDDASTHAEKLFQTCWNIGEGTDVDL